MAADQKITTFLMFTGKAEEAMNFYISLFEHSEITSMIHQKDGSVLHATFTLKGQTFMCIDSSITHEFTFTPSMSLYVKCDSIEEINILFEKLTKGGSVLMPLGELPGYEKFGWVQDQYGVSWQLSLASN